MCELYHYIKRLDVKRPVDFTTGTIVEIAVHKAEQTLWDKKSSNVHSTITLSLQPNIHNIIKDFETL